MCSKPSQTDPRSTRADVHAQLIGGVDAIASQVLGWAVQVALLQEFGQLRYELPGGHDSLCNKPSQTDPRKKRADVHAQQIRTADTIGSQTLGCAVKSNPETWRDS